MISNTLAKIFGFTLVLVGAAMLNAPYFTAVMNNLLQNPGLLWLAGLITFVFGMVLVALHNVWSRDWRVVVTILAWLTVIKGAAIVAFPETTMMFYGSFVFGIINYACAFAIILGAILLWLGFAKPTKS